MRSTSAANWTSRRSTATHVALAIWVPGCALACWWQVRVALSGDDLGWVYSVMWPCFAVFGIVFWWHVVHDDPEEIGARGLRQLERNSDDPAGEEARRRSEEAIRLAEEQDPELATYNEYLAELARQDDARPRSPTRRR